jgi:hypothetical protein
MQCPATNLFLKPDKCRSHGLKEMVKQAGADAVIITRLIRVETKADVAPGAYGPFPGFGFYRWYSSAWVGFYEPPRLNFYDIYISETSLYDVAQDQLVWSGIAKTTELGDIGKEIKEYVEIIIKGLNNRNLLRKDPKISIRCLAQRRKGAKNKKFEARNLS